MLEFAHTFFLTLEPMCTFGLMSPRHWRWSGFGGSALPGSEYYLKQAQLAAHLALVESNPEKARALHILALDYYDKAEKAKVEEARDKAG